MLDLYIQISFALLLAFLLGYLIAKMFTQNKQNTYLAKIAQLNAELKTTDEFKQQQSQKISLLQQTEQQLKIDIEGLTTSKTTLELELNAVNKNLNDKQQELINAVKNKQKTTQSLEKETQKNRELENNLSLVAEQQNALNTQIEILTENWQNTLQSLQFMEGEATVFSVQQSQLQQSLQESTQQYEFMSTQINNLLSTEKEKIADLHHIEKEYECLEFQKQTIEQEKINYCDKLSTADKECTMLSAHTVVRNHTFGAMSVAVIPLPLFDLAAILSIQVKMLSELAKKYQVPFVENRVKSLIFPLFGSTFTITGAMFFSSFIKIVPGVGQASGIISVSILAATATYAVGELFVEHFESGGTFLDFNAKTKKTRFNELYEKGKLILFKKEGDQLNTGQNRQVAHK